MIKFFLLLLFVISSVVYANEIEIEDTFEDLNQICIYNSTNSDIKAQLEDKTNSAANISEMLLDYAGVIEKKSGIGKITIEPDNLRSKVIYYHLNVSGPQNDNYKLVISGNDDGIKASACPTNSLAEIANTSSANIANAALIAGVLVGMIFFAGIVYVLMPSSDHSREWD